MSSLLYPYLAFQSHILYLKYKMNRPWSKDRPHPNNSTPISAYMNQKIGFKSPGIHTLLKMEGNNSLSKGQPQNSTWVTPHASGRRLETKRDISSVNKIPQISSSVNIYLLSVETSVGLNNQKTIA